MVSSIFLFSPRNPGEDGSNLTNIFHSWVETNNQKTPHDRRTTGFSSKGPHFLCQIQPLWKASWPGQSPDEQCSFHPGWLFDIGYEILPFFFLELEEANVRIPTRWAPTNYKWSYKPYKWPYKWVTGVITLLIGVITPLITGRSPP